MDERVRAGVAVSADTGAKAFVEKIFNRRPSFLMAGDQIKAQAIQRPTGSRMGKRLVNTMCGEKI